MPSLRNHKISSKKRAWSEEEDNRLVELVGKYGPS